MLAKLSGGLAALVVVALISISLAGRSPSLSLALQQTQSASAAWWNTYPQYDNGWPMPHNVPAGTPIPGMCSSCGAINSYADAYVQSNQSQAVVIKTSLTNSSNGVAGVNSSWHYSQTQNGSIPTVSAGTPVVIEWACQDYTARAWSVGGSCRSYDAFGNCTSWTSGSGGTAYFNYYGGSASSNFNGGGGYVSSVVVTPTVSTTYSVQCLASGIPAGSGNAIVPATPAMSFTVNVAAPPPPPLPTETISAGAGPGVAKTVNVGTPVTITATYAAGAGDSLTNTAIDGPNSTNSVPGVAWLPPTSPKTYVFTPSAAGTYTFYPSLQSSYYSAWNNYSSSVTVTAVAPTCANGLDYATYGPSCTCPAGQTQSGSVCVASSCSDPHAGNPPTCACQAPYTGPNGGPCALPPPSITLKAAQSRVQKGAHASLTWSATNLAGNGSQTCQITSNPAGVFSSSFNGLQTSWTGTNVATGPINATTIFTLSCTGAQSVSTSVGLIPSYLEQ
jgi:hypothetical protein